jgi:imidazoleglycerol-phosphate dehydratase
MMKARTAKIKRHTLETRISLRLNLDGKGKSKIRTGIPFFDHMLTLFAKHATVDLELRCDGDLAVDAHHTVEDCGIALGQAVAAALGDKRGIRRYGWFAPRPPGKKKVAAPPGPKPMCRWMNVSRAASWISADGRFWSGAD